VATNKGWRLTLEQ